MELYLIYKGRLVKQLNQNIVDYVLDSARTDMVCHIERSRDVFLN